MYPALPLGNHAALMQTVQWLITRPVIAIIVLVAMLYSRYNQVPKRLLQIMNLVTRTLSVGTTVTVKCYVRITFSPFGTAHSLFRYNLLEFTLRFLFLHSSAVVTGLTGFNNSNNSRPCFAVRLCAFAIPAQLCADTDDSRLTTFACFACPLMCIYNSALPSVRPCVDMGSTMDIPSSQ